jgi:hypothetical protein
MRIASFPRLAGALITVGASLAMLALPAASASAAVTSQPAGIPGHQVATVRLAGHITGDISVLSSGQYDAVLVSPAGVRQVSPRTFGTEAAARRYLARVGDLLAGRPHAVRHAAVMSPSWSINLPCGFSCGANSSGGDHFWVIASYQQIANVTLLAAFGAACLAFLGPEINGWAAPACGAATYILKTLAANQPRVSNHGVWASVYFSHPWSPQSGRY